MKELLYSISSHEVLKSPRSCRQKTVYFPKTKENLFCLRSMRSLYLLFPLSIFKLVFFSFLYCDYLVESSFWPSTFLLHYPASIPNKLPGLYWFDRRMMCIFWCFCLEYGFTVIFYTLFAGNPFDLLSILFCQTSTITHINPSMIDW